MSPARTSDLAFRLGDRLRVDPPWEIYAERNRRFEVHLQGSEVELERGPVTVEGYGLRVFRPHGEGLGAGFQASTDTTEEGLRAAVDDAETTARYAEFPARSVSLPADGHAMPSVPIVDEKLWREPMDAIHEYVRSLLAPFEGRRGAAPSFGSVRATLSEVSIANSSGLRTAFHHTQIELELAIKSFGGPEGAPPGEYWVNETTRRLEPQKARASVDAWCGYAADVRKAKAPPNGDLAVVLPADVLAGIVPQVLGFRLSGVARLRKIAPEVGSEVGSKLLTVRDDGTHAWSPGSTPVDDEGAPRSAQTLVDRGKVEGLLYDALYASAFQARSTGSALRSGFGPFIGRKFAQAPGPGPSTMVVSPGDGGSLEEVCEAAGDGILVRQLGWASPDPLSGAFGGEVRIGYRIRGGKIAEPVRGGTVGGVVLAPKGSPSLLANLEVVGSDTSLVESLVSPTVLVRPLVVAGASG